MTTIDQSMRSGLTRRGFLGAGAALAAGGLLAGCGDSSGSSGGGASGKTLKFWDMAWGTPAYPQAAKDLTGSYQPSSGLAAASYQSIPWASFVQTFASAIASKTGPAVSSGAAFQVFQFFKQGVIAPADNLVAALPKDDFLPGTIDALKYEGSYIAVPWQVDIRVLFYRKSVLDNAGVDVPTDWPSLRAACVALQKQGSSGFGIVGTGGWQQILPMMLNNGGGLFNASAEPDCVTDRNLETLEFLKELASIGAIAKRFVSYNGENILSDLSSGKVALLIGGPGTEAQVDASKRADVLVASPLTGPHGDKGTLSWVNNLMMYTNTPSQESSEAFLRYYLDNMKLYWQKETLPSALPVRKSIAALPEFQKNKNAAKIVAEWQPVGRSTAALAPTPIPALNAIEGGQALANFSQRIIQGADNPKRILQDLQNGLESLM